MWTGFVIFYAVTIALPLLPFVPQWALIVWITGMLLWTAMLFKFEGMLEIIVSTQKTEETVRLTTTLAAETFRVMDGTLRVMDETFRVMDEADP